MLANELEQLNNRGYEYNIFLCFAANDKQTSFIQNLCNALRCKGFNLLMNDSAIEERESDGDHIWLSDLKVLAECKRSIIVVSENLIASRYCLAQLVHILECRKAMSQLIFPIFYRLERDPRRFLYGDWFTWAFNAHYRWYGAVGWNNDKVKEWESTLLELQKLEGWYVQKGLGYESEVKLMQETVQAITNPSPRYDVFLSFCGEDTRYSFTGFLYRALCRKGLKTFMDDEGLVSGNEISTNLLEAIQSSRLSIVVFSENYGYSTWCLDEFAKIIECIKTKNQFVLPIFYKVQQRDVCYQTKSYCDAMIAHEKRFGNNSHNVQKWRSALSQVAYLKEEHTPEDEYEHEFIKKIVEMAYKDVANHSLHQLSLSS